jgi:alpha-1,2-glucosyltransferase
MKYFIFLRHNSTAKGITIPGILSLLLHQDCMSCITCQNAKLLSFLSRYLISNVIAYIGNTFQYDLCSVNALRFTNILFAIGLYYVLQSLITTLSPQSTAWKSQMYALALSWFPISFFFNFVYYTDPGSTFLVLWSYLLIKQKRYALAGIIGMLSLTFRQTNVIWLCLFTVVIIIDTLTAIDTDNRKKNDISSALLFNPSCSSISSSSNVSLNLYLNTLK